MLNYTDEIRSASTQEPLFYKPTIDGEELDNTSTGTISIWNANAETAIVENQTLTWNSSKKRFEFSLDTSDKTTWKIEKNYRACVKFSYQSKNYERVFYFDLVLDPWRTSLSMSDLTALAPSAAYESEATIADYKLVINQAEEQIRLFLKARGIPAGWIRNKAALDRCHRLLSLSLLYLRNASELDSSMWAKHIKYQEQYEKALVEMLSKAELDEDQDNNIDLKSKDAQKVRLSP